LAVSEQMKKAWVPAFAGMNGVRKRTVKALIATLALIALPAAAHAESYLRAGLAYERSRETGFRDLDCASTAPPALYGCGVSAGGAPLTARGDFGSTVAGELGVGTRISPYLRIEAVATYRPDLDFRGDANFVRTPGEQRVTADGSSLSAMGAVYADLGLYGRLRPFLGVGLGASRNRIGAVRFDFPGLAPGAATVTPGGKRTELAWMATAGFSTALSKRLTLDLAYRYVDLGEVRTDAGPAQIVRASGTRTIAIAPTRTALKAEGVSVSLRWGF
jgi:opacity protein-like surface antigen